MNRNYLPPSLMHQQQQVGSGSSGSSGATAMMAQSPQQQLSQSYGVYHHQGNQSLPHPLSAPIIMHHGPPSSVPTPMSLSGTPNPAQSITGGMMMMMANSGGGGHPFHSPSNSGPANSSQQPHQQSQNSYQTPYQQVTAGVVASQNTGPVGQPVGGGPSPLSTTPQPIRLGRIDRFSRTCKLPTVQEVGKLQSAAVPEMNEYSPSCQLSRIRTKSRMRHQR